MSPNAELSLSYLAVSEKELARKRAISTGCFLNFIPRQRATKTTNMNSEEIDFDYPPRFYKTVPELSLLENRSIAFANYYSFSELDERVHYSSEGSKIAEYFNGKSIFITGGTGFLGKLLIEKLLRTCKDLETIYVLVRPKKGKDVESRIDEILSSLVFSVLEKKQPKFRHKIVAIKGDVALPALGISLMDRQKLIEKVDVIFHVAATVRFDETLHLATSINISGTKEVLLLAKECSRLSSLVHVSTAFSQCTRKIIGEKFYTPPFLPDQIIKMVETNSEEFLEKNRELILRGWPNTYSFTKAIAEHAVKTMADNIPACIFRPCIVTSAYREPLRSWIDNLYGPMGAIVGVGTGVLRSFHADPAKIADMIPCDYVVNGMIAAAYNNQFNKKGEVKIYNHVSSSENPITWGDFQNLAIYYGFQNPTIKAIWYPSNKMNKNKYIHLVSILFLHFLPAFLIDGYFTIIGKRRRMVQMYKKIQKFCNVLAPFSTNEWKFRNDNVQKLWHDLSDVDKKLFSFSMAERDFNWNNYLSLLGSGVRLYLLKDDESTIPAARKKYITLYYCHRALQGFILLLALRLLLWILGPLIQQLLHFN